MVLQKKNFDSPDKTQAPPFSKVDTIIMGDMTLMKYLFQPGWRWSKDVKPLAGTSSCQMHHFGVYVSGRMKVKADNGEEIEFGPGDVADIPPGHDGWVVGNEPVIFYSFAPKANQK